MVIAVLFSDVHLSHTPPVARAAEPNWYAAQDRVLNEVRAIIEEHNAIALCAGDVFDHYRPPPELLNFAIARFPPCFAIPGQHDLPCHVYGDIKKSGYWTLVEADVLEHLDRMHTFARGGWLDGLTLHGYPWGHGITEISDMNDGLTHVALAHVYIWQAGCSYPGAPELGHVSRFKQQLAGYRAAVCGDNHKNFLYETKDLSILNCGALIRRKSDEMDYHPAVGLLHNDGHITQHFLDTSKDRWADEAYKEQEDIKEASVGLRQFIRELGGLAVDSLDFRDAVRRYVVEQGVLEGVKKILLESIE